MAKVISRRSQVNKETTVQSPAERVTETASTQTPCHFQANFNEIRLSLKNFTITGEFAIRKVGDKLVIEATGKEPNTTGPDPPPPEE